MDDTTYMAHLWRSTDRFAAYHSKHLADVPHSHD